MITGGGGGQTLDNRGGGGPKKKYAPPPTFFLQIRYPLSIRGITEHTKLSSAETSNAVLDLNSPSNIRKTV